MVNSTKRKLLGDTGMMYYFDLFDETGEFYGEAWLQVMDGMALFHPKIYNMTRKNFKIAQKDFWEYLVPIVKDFFCIDEISFWTNNYKFVKSFCEHKERFICIVDKKALYQIGI